MSNTSSYESWLATEVIAGGLKHNPELQRELVAQFYRWLNSVKADAWEEGYSVPESNCGVPCGACDFCMSEVENPYRKGDTGV